MHIRTRIIWLFVVALFLPLLAHAAGECCVTLVGKDGSRTLFYLSDQPIISYVDNMLVVKSTKREVQVAIASIQYVDLSEVGGRVATAIEQPHFQANSSRMLGLRPGSAVQAYTVDGQLLQTFQVSADGEADIDLSSLPRGIVILRTATTSFKITNK